MQVALDLLDTEAEPSTSRAQLLDYMSYATYQVGHNRMDMHSVYVLLKIVTTLQKVVAKGTYLHV